MPESLPVALRDQEQMMPGFARWMYHAVRRDLGNLVLDAGAGIGTFTEILVKDGRQVSVLEPDPDFVEHIQTRFEGDSRVSIHQGSLTEMAALAKVPEVDSVLCLNVFEHIDDDVSAMQNLLAKTRVGGTMVALVPAYPWLFNKMDTAVGHYRRYGKAQFGDRLSQAGWKVERISRFNAFGIPGWFVSGTLLRRSTPGKSLYKLFDVLVPAFSALERLLVRGSVGLSLIAVCRRPE